jgi:hypothetical protein
MMRVKKAIGLGLWLVFGFIGAGLAVGAGFEPFVVTATDEATGKGVPLVELRTVNKVSILTDRAGRAAIYEPGLMGVGEVYLHITAPHGYEAGAKEGCGNGGTSFKMAPGGKAEIKLKRAGTTEKRPELTEREAFRLRHAYAVAPGAYRPFGITVKDEATGRGVPCAELWTEGMQYVTDSAGRIAFFEPGLMGKEVAFSVKSYGYEGPAGGVTLKAEPGGRGEVTIRRVNIAERLYRITGEGIYHDSVLLGETAPLEKPLLSGKVGGQDTVAMTEYKGKLFWRWGDTERPAYPLGNFKTSSARSLVPGRGGLEPEAGVNLEYFVNGEGFSKPMFPRADAGLVWMGSLASVTEGASERLVASYAAMEGGAKVFESGMAVFNDAAETFETLAVYGSGHYVRPAGPAYKREGYVYVNEPYPVIRMRAELAAVRDPNGYEAFTCLMPGTGFAGEKTTLERDAAGRPVWGWKRNTSPLDDGQWEKLVKAGLAKPEEAWNRITDVATGKPVRVQHGSAAYNAYTKCWVMVFNESFGQSFLGEVWIAAAPSAEGPWRKAVKIVTHSRKGEPYTFYNAVQHPGFERDGGRTIYFEGTYVTTFSGNETPTPRYDYNQILYKVDLADQRLAAIFE